jgi:phosphate:Na+ symporter
MSDEAFQRAHELEERIDHLRNQLKKRSRKRMQDESSDIKHELLYLDIVRHAEHLGDFTLRIAQSLAEDLEVEDLVG